MTAAAGLDQSKMRSNDTETVKAVPLDYASPVKVDSRIRRWMRRGLICLLILSIVYAATYLMLFHVLDALKT
jgi:hypothetical protein